MMPGCPVAGGSDDPDSEDRWVGPSDVTPLIQSTEDGTCPRHPEERSEVAGGGPTNDESRLLRDVESCQPLRSPERGKGRRHDTQVPDPQKPPDHLSPRSTQTAVVSSQPGVSQIVLNFREQGDELALDSVSPEAVSQCHRGCHSSQRVAKQIVLIFVNQPCESSKQSSSRSCGGPACTVNASTQTGGGMCHVCPPPRSPHTCVRSCGTQTEWDRRHERPERSPVHVNVPSISHPRGVAPRTSHSTQTECSLRVPERSSPPSCTISQEEEEEGAPGRTFRRGQGVPGPSESFQGPADTLTSSRADVTRECEDLSAPPSGVDTQDPPDHCPDCDRSPLSTSQTKASNGSEDVTHWPRDVFTHNPPPPHRDTQPPSEEPMEAATSEDQTAERHSDHMPATSPRIPCHASLTQADQSEECPCPPGKRLLDSGEGKPEITDNPALKSLDRCDVGPERHSCSSASNPSLKLCAASCLPPSLNQYLNNLLEQHSLSLNDPVHHQNRPPSSSPSPCAPLQPHVRQIILNFLEKESGSVSAHVSSPSISSRTSSSLTSMAGNPNIPGPGTASDAPISLISKSEKQAASGLGASLMTSMPGDQDVVKPGNSKDVLSPVLMDRAGDQGFPKPSNRTDLSSSEQPTSKPLSQDVGSPSSARDASSLLITSVVVSQDNTGRDAAGDTHSSYIMNRPGYQDVSEPDRTKNPPSPLLNKAASQDVPGFSSTGDEPDDVVAPDTSSISSSALAKDQQVHQDVPGHRDLPSSAVLPSKPEHQDYSISDIAGDSSLRIISRPVTRDVSSPGSHSDLSASMLTSRPVTRDVSSPGSHSDLSASMLTSRPVTRDVSSPGTHSDLSASMLTSRPVTRDVSTSDTMTHTPSSIPLGEDVPGPGTPSSVLIRSHLQDTQTGEETPEEVIKKSREGPESPPCQPQRPPKSHSCPALVLEAVTSSATQGAELRLPMAEREEGLLQNHSGAINEVTFDDIAVYFSKEEWEVLEGPQKGLYCQVMMDNYHSLSSLGFLLDKPGLISRIEDEEAELWEDRRALGGFSLYGGDHPPFPALCTADVRSLEEDKETSVDVGGESAKSSSHLGALMRLVNKIPGFLLGGSSPGQNLEDAENIRPCSEVKTEESSPSCTPTSVHTLRIEETSEYSGPGPPWGVEKNHHPAPNKAEEVEIPIRPPHRQNRPTRRPPLPPPHIKTEPGACTGASPPRELQFKQEELPVTCGPAGGVPGKRSDASSVKIRSSLVYKYPAPGPWECPPSGDGDTWMSLPPSLSSAAFPRNTGASPTSLPDGTALRDHLHVKIKEEDSGSERDPAESPIHCRPHPGFTTAPSPGVLEHLRLGASPRRSAMDRKSPRPQEMPHGKSHLHGLVNCLKEISASRSWAQPSAPSSGRCGGETDRSPADPSRAMKRSAQDPSSPSRVLSVLWRPPDDILKDEPYVTSSGPPNPFTVAVTNGAARLRGAEVKMAESFRSRVAEPPAGGALISERCPDRGPTRPSAGPNLGSRGFQKSELGVKRTHSDDPSHPPVGTSAAKRPTLDSSSPSRVMGTLWIPPDDGKCPLMSVRNCVRKIPNCWAAPPPVRGSGSSFPEPCHTRTGIQGGSVAGKMVEVKEERSPTPTRQWIPPTRSPRNSPDQSGASSTNIHLSGLMRLMEEIPVAESSSSSRAMYNIAIGHSMMRRPDRTNFLSYYNDDGGFQAELNDNTVASMDSVYSDDTSLSSENLDPSYSAIGGLQRVVSEFAELGSVSPLVALSVPPSTNAHEGHGPKAKEPAPASTPRANDAARGSQRGTPMSAASVCSAEDGEAAYAALCGLQKVVRGFNEQECMSPFSAVRNAPHHGGLRESLTKKSFAQEEEGESPRPPDSSPVLGTRFLCEGSWLSKADSSYSALSGLQKVVNGFSDLGCVSPFSAVSTSASESAIEICSRKKSEQPALDVSCSALIGLKKVVNGVTEGSCMSPATASSNPSSVGEPDPGVRRRCEQSEAHTDSARCHGPSNTSQKNPPRSSGQCIDLTQEEEPAKARTPNQYKQSARNEFSGGRTPELSTGQAAKPMGGRTRPPACGQLIDLTEEEETPVRHKVQSAEAARKPHSVSLLSASLHKATSDRKHRVSTTGARTQRVSVDRPLDPGPSGAHRAGIPAVNEHISGLEKLLKGVPTFTPPNAPSGQRRSGGWWFKSTSPHET